jgi:segregation and condensation protein B
MKKQQEKIENSKQENLPNIEDILSFNPINLQPRLHSYVNLVEGIILSAPDGISISTLTSMLKEYHDINNLEVKQIIFYIKKQWEDKALELIESSYGWRFQTKPILTPYLQKLNNDKPIKYSRATMEIISIIAYKQPVTRGDIESIRGVTINNNSIKILEERGWIEVIGQREVAGRPNLYGTTSQFLSDLGLLSLGQLPPLQQEELSV